VSRHPRTDGRVAERFESSSSFLFVAENNVAKASTLLQEDLVAMSGENARPAVSVNDVPQREEEADPETTADEAASDPPTPLPVSRVPPVRAEDVADYDAYQKHVQCIVNQWLVGKQNQQRNPRYEQNALTSFLLMVCISSFLETAQDAVKRTYEKLNEKQPFWWTHKDYLAIDQLQTRKFCKHKRQGAVWRFLKKLVWEISSQVNLETSKDGRIGCLVNS